MEQTDRYYLELLMLRVQEMRAAQDAYFKNTGHAWLKASKVREQAVDDLGKHLRRMGFDPENVKGKGSKQSDIFEG